MSQLSSKTNVGPGSGLVRYLQGDSGGQVGPNAAQTIFVLGGNNITVAGNPGTFTETFSVSGTTNHSVLLGNATGSISSLANGTTGQVLHAITGANDPQWSAVSLTADVTGVLSIANGGTGRATLTNHGLLVGAGTAAITQLAAATNGQLPIGSTGADPVLATLTAGTNIAITNAAGSITIAASGGASLTWSVIAVNQTAVINNGYFCNKAGTLALALPAASAVGDIIEVSNINTATGIQFTQAAGQQIFIGNTSTTLGAAGTLTSSQVGDSLKLVCGVANTFWYAVSFVGNWTPA